MIKRWLAVLVSWVMGLEEDEDKVSRVMGLGESLILWPQAVWTLLIYNAPCLPVR